jgi:hypothetical protein
MNAEAVLPRFTPQQLENQRLFQVGAPMPEQAGDKGKRMRNKFAIFVAATGADLIEGWGAEKIIEKFVDPNIEAMPEEKQKRAKVFKSGGMFVEDGVSDEIYNVGMNAILRNITGLEEVAYASPTAKFISGWTNLLSFASAKFNDTFNEDGSLLKKMAFWKKPWNVVNAVNVEAALGLFEEAPFGIGSTVVRMHSAFDNKLRKSEALQLANTAATLFVTGYHIEKNMVQGSK